MNLHFDNDKKKGPQYREPLTKEKKSHQNKKAIFILEVISKLSMK
jgi:hypothetical protein